MKIYVQKQIQTLYTPNNKKQSMKFNIIKQNETGINHIHGKTVDDKGHVLKINFKRFKISDFTQHIKNKDSYKLNSSEIYKIYDESKIKSKPKSLKTKSKTVDKKKKKPSTKTSKTVDKKKKKPSTKTSKTVDKKKKTPSSKTVDKKVIIKKKSKISKK
jgi:hypothetical protein